MQSFTGYTIWCVLTLLHNEIAHMYGAYDTAILYLLLEGYSIG